MKDYALKFRHIMPMYMYIVLGTVVVWGVVRYVFGIQLGLLDFKTEVWELWVPLGLPWVPITIWLRPKTRILNFRKHDDQRKILFQFLAWITMAFMMITSQKYIVDATSELQTVANVDEISQRKASRYYKIEKFKIVPELNTSYADFRTSGRYQERLVIKLYFICPMEMDTSLDNTFLSLKHWYGVMFSREISNRDSNEVKERQFNEFYEECANKMDVYDFHDVSYFVRLANSDDRDNFLKAIKEKAGREIDAVVLEPEREPFEARKVLSPLVTIYGFVGGTGLFLLLLLWPNLKKVELERQLQGKKPASDDVIDMLKYLIPSKDHFATSVILDLNLIVFIVMVGMGVHIMSPNAIELMQWGANRRPETTGGEWWRLVTSMFVHGGIVHLAYNGFGLIIASTVLEPIIGAVRYTIIYIVSGIAGSVASIWWHENTASVGASGAIFGLMGAVMVLGLLGKYGREKKMMLIMFGPYVALGLLFGLAGGIDNAGHIGGLAGGMVMAVIVGMVMKKKRGG